MAIIMDVNQTKFFEHVLFGYPTQLGFAKSLDVTGYKFQVNLFGITASKDSKSAILSLNTSTSNLMKANFKSANAPAVEKMAAQKIANFIDELYSDWLSTTAEPGIVAGLNLGAMASGTGTDSEYYEKPVNTVGYGVDVAEGDSGTVILTSGKKVKVGAKPINLPPKKSTTVVALKDATYVGQKVKGTSPGSTYEVVALNERVKVATKIDGGNLSIRAEVQNPTYDDMALLKSSGLIWNGSYGSMHIDAGTLQMVRRTLGAFLFGTGIEFDSQVTAKDVV